jgi:HPt (histidine-containing phosphotransfer) domain-containing protein
MPPTLYPIVVEGNLRALPGIQPQRRPFFIDADIARAVVYRLRGEFVSQASQLGSELSSVLETKDMQPEVIIGRVQKIAHTIAGTAATFGFPALGEIAFNLDQSIRADDLQIVRIRQMASELLVNLREIAPDCG